MERSSEPHAAARAATVLTALSVLSPLAGLAVDMTLAWRFGISATVDAFRIGALVMLFGQQLFSAQILPHIIVPMFSEYRAQGKETEAWQVALSMANLLVIPTALVALSVCIWPRPVVTLLGPGLVDEAYNAAVFFVRWCALTFVPLVWSGVLAGILFAQEIFWPPVTSQLLSNLILTLAILCGGRASGPASLAGGVLLAACVSCLLLLLQLAPLARQAGVRTFLIIDASHPGLRQACRLAVPLLGTVAVMQWSAIILNRVLSQLPVGTLATFGYAWKLGQIVSLLPAALATVLFPRLAGSWHSSVEEEFRAVCTNALRMALFLTLPLTCICFVMRHPLVALLFQRGAFLPEAAEAAARLFGLLLVGVPAAVGCVYFQKMLYAVQEARRPAYAQLVGALFLTVMASRAAMTFGADGVALVAVVVPWVTCGWLLFVLHQRCYTLPIMGLGVFGGKILPLAMIAAWCGSEGEAALRPLLGPGILSLNVSFIGGALLALLLFYGVTLLLHLPEATQGQRYLQWQGKMMVRKIQNALLG